MAISKTDTGRIVLSNAEYVHITPWTSEDAIGAETLDITNIVGDTLNFTPDENTVNSIESEFKDDPLFENVTLGKYQFGADCIDFQNKILQSIYKWTEGTTSKAMYAPKGYKDVFATIEVGFRNENTIVIAPKVKMNSKATLASFKTSTGVGNLAGTANSASIAVGGDTDAIDSPLVIAPSLIGEADTTYTIKVGETTTTFKAGDGIQAS